MPGTSLKNIIGLLFICIVHQGIAQVVLPQVQQAETYFIQHPVKSKFNYLILKFISKHNQVLSSSFVDHLDDYTQFAGYTDEVDAEKFAKLINPEMQLDTSLIFQQRGLQQWMLWTLYTDQLPPDLRYFNLADSLIQAGNPRDLTHIGIFLGFLDLQKMYATNPKVVKLKQTTHKALKKICKQHSLEQDTWLEAMIARQLMQQSKILSPALLNKFLSNQLADGGWAYSLVDGEPSNEHTTILALWLLNNYFYYQHD